MAVPVSRALACIGALPDGIERDRLEIRARGGLATANFAVYGWADERVMAGLPEAFAVAQRIDDKEAAYRFLHYQAVHLGNRCDFVRASPVIAQLIKMSESTSFGDLSVVGKAAV